MAGPTIAPPELAARKLLALYDRAEARDFADAYTLMQHFDRDETLAMTKRIDLGFDTAVFAQMLQTLQRFSDDRIPLPTADIPRLRDYFHTWAIELARATP